MSTKPATPFDLAGLQPATVLEQALEAQGELLRLEAEPTALIQCLALLPLLVAVEL